MWTRACLFACRVHNRLCSFFTISMYDSMCEWDGSGYQALERPPGDRIGGLLAMFIFTVVTIGLVSGSIRWNKVLFVRQKSRVAAKQISNKNPKRLRLSNKNPRQFEYYEISAITSTTGHKGNANRGCHANNAKPTKNLNHKFFSTTSPRYVKTFLSVSCTVTSCSSSGRLKFLLISFQMKIVTFSVVLKQKDDWCL